MTDRPMSVITVQYANDGDYWVVKKSGRLSKTVETKEDAIDKAKAATTVGDVVHIKCKKGYVEESHEREEWTPLLGFFAE